jgi:hypothetical protein
MYPLCAPPFPSNTAQSPVFIPSCGGRFRAAMTRHEPVHFAGNDSLRHVAADAALPTGMPDRSSAGPRSQLTQIVNNARQAAWPHIRRRRTALWRCPGPPQRDHATVHRLHLHCRRQPQALAAAGLAVLTSGYPVTQELSGMTKSVTSTIGRRSSI